MKIKGILVSTVVPMANHIANGGEKLLGNASSIKRRPDGKVYISGQMQRHVIFRSMEHLNYEDPARGSTFVSNGDGVTNEVERDLRADLGGFLHVSKGSYSGRRIAPLTATPAVSLGESEVGRDLLLRLKIKQEAGAPQAIATKEYSQADDMLMNFHLDVTALSVSRKFEYSGENDGMHVRTEFVKHCSDEERLRRAKLFVESTRFMLHYANQARNAVQGEPQKVLIVFDPRLSRKAIRFFEAGAEEQKFILNELRDREARYFIGDDTLKTEGSTSVLEAYKTALAFLTECGTSLLYDPTDGGKPVAFADAFNE
ncbi:MAG: type I-PGING CRISPR-associated protein Cas7/Csp1 [Ignavibacteriaceae bacterium]|nr:type I-PGING CRISPR-associated protein Cas7/Csp1 [Ignavibacteriaceae bacterium]